MTTLHRLEEEVHSNLQQKIQQFESQISETQVILDKETSKYQSACRQQEVSIAVLAVFKYISAGVSSFSHIFFLLLCIQSMHAKQKSLLERVDALDEDCEELQRQLGESEERQVILHNELRQMREEKEQQQAQLEQEQVYRSPVPRNTLVSNTL